MNNEIIVQLQKSNLEIEAKENLKNAFGPYFERAKKLENEAKNIIITSSKQKNEMQMARQYRLELKNIRVNVDKKRAELKAEGIRKGKAIEGMANIIKYLIMPIEEHLVKQEKFIEIQEQQKKIEIENNRINELKKYLDNEDELNYYNLKEMSDKSYNDLLEATKINYINRKELEKEEENKRIALEKAEAEQKEKIKIENARLKKEAEEREAKQEAERKEYENKIKIEREKKEKIEAELKAKQEAERKAKQAELDRIEKEKQEKIRIEKEKQLAPDKKKLEQLAIKIVSLEMPEVNSKESKEIINQVVELLNKTSNFIKTKIIDL